MKRQDGTRARHAGAHQHERHQSGRQVAAEVQVHNVVTQPHQQANQAEGMLRVVHLICLGLPVTGDVDDRAGVSALSKKLSQRHKMGLDSAVGRREWTQQENPHSIAMPTRINP